MSDLPHTRQSLLIRLADRCDDAWSEFLKIYENALIEYARRRGLQDADARDVTQEVLAAVETKIQSWDSDSTRGSFRGWLFRAARNIAVDKIRERAKTPPTGGSHNALHLQEVAEERMDDEFLADYRRQLFQWAAEHARPQVNDTTWRAFWLTAVEGLDAEQAAAQLSLSKGNVYAAKFRVTLKIQKLAAKFQYEDEPAGLQIDRKYND